MRRFRSILFCPLAARDNAAAGRRLGELAVANGATLTLFGVAPHPSALQRIRHRRDHIAAVREALDRETVDRLERARPAIAGLDPVIETAGGNPAVRIIERVVTGGHDLLVVTTDGDSRDPTVNHLLRKCPCPVWVIRPTRARTTRVLAAVDPDPAQADLNRTVLELAASMAEIQDGELHLVHAWQLYGEEVMRHSAFMHTPEGEIRTMLREEETIHRAAVDEMLAEGGLDDRPWRIHLHHGEPAEVVPDVTRRHRINLLVMGTVGRTGLSGLLIGNTAESILDQVRCSVIAVKPSGFVTPIRPAPDEPA